MKTENAVRIKTRLKLFKGFPSLVPYLSVFFILEIFILIGSSFVPISGIQVELPVASTKTSEAKKKFVVTVDREGIIYFNDMPMENIEVLKANMIGMMRANVKNADEREVLVIRADKSNTIDTLAPLMALAEDLDIKGVMIMANPPERQAVNFMETER